MKIKYLFLILAVVSIIVLITSIYYGYTMQFRIEKLFISEVQGKYINITDGADDYIIQTTNTENNIVELNIQFNENYEKVQIKERIKIYKYKNNTYGLAMERLDFLRELYIYILTSFVLTWVFLYWYFNSTVAEKVHNFIKKYM